MESQSSTPLTPPPPSAPSSGLAYPIHHIGIAVKDIDAGVARYAEHLSYRELPREKVEEFGAEVAFLLPQGAMAGMTALEVIAPLSEDSALARFLEKRGEGLHHICFSVNDIQEEQQRLTPLGYQFTSEAPRLGAHNGLVLFAHPRSTGGILIELRQENEGQS